MRNIKLIVAIIMIVLLPIAFFAVESYTVKTVTKAPKIGDKLDPIWKDVTLVEAKKPVVDKNRTIELTPSPEDFSLSFGALWDKKGLYLLIKFVDDKFVREIYKDDPISDWSREDNISLLFNKNHAFNAGEPPLEFAWIVTYTVEAKATKRFNVPAEYVKMQWIQEGTTYWGQIFIDWRAFNKKVKAGDKIPFELRGRDDDQTEGRIQDYPQSFYQWSTDQKGVEASGIDMGELILSPDKIK